MIERTPVLIAAALAALTMTGCGDRAAAPGVGGESALASEEPVDAVPLPLDVTPLSPPPVAVPAAAVATKAAETEAPTEIDPAASTATPAVPAEAAAARPARVVVAPREPSRESSRPVERPAPSPSPSQDREPEKPVLTF